MTIYNFSSFRNEKEFETFLDSKTIWEALPVATKLDSTKSVKCTEGKLGVGSLLFSCSLCYFFMHLFAINTDEIVD